MANARTEVDGGAKNRSVLEDELNRKKSRHSLSFGQPLPRDSSLGYPCMEYANESRDKRLEQYGMPHNFRQLQPSANETKHLSHAHHLIDFVDELREGEKLLQMFQGN